MLSSRKAFVICKRIILKSQEKRRAQRPHKSQFSLDFLSTGVGPLDWLHRDLFGRLFICCRPSWRRGPWSAARVNTRASSYSRSGLYLACKIRKPPGSRNSWRRRGDSLFWTHRHFISLHRKAVSHSKKSHGLRESPAGLCLDDFVAGRPRGRNSACSAAVEHFATGCHAGE